MKAPLVEITEEQYCIRLDRKYVTISALKHMVAGLHTKYESAPPEERHFDDLHTKTAEGTHAGYWDRLEDK